MLLYAPRGIAGKAIASPEKHKGHKEAKSGLLCVLPAMLVNLFHSRRISAMIPPSLKTRWGGENHSSLCQRNPHSALI
jgi:hypothetical protein